MITVNTQDTSYEIELDDKLREDLGQRVSRIWTARKVMIITDHHVGPLYLDEVSQQLRDAGFTVATTTVNAGEGAKSIAVAEKILTRMTELGFTRSDGVFALGGGVVTDLSGVIASLYMRGIGLIQMPTSLLAQVDASIGGKTALNLAGIKNVIGSFYQPDLVLVDPSTLATMPARDYAAGYAEVIKMSLLAGGEFAEMTGAITSLADVREHQMPLIEASILFKKKIVEEDVFDHGQRQTLNFGHTFGHAIELLSDGELRHGEAIGIGMVTMSDRFERDGYTEAGTTEAIVQRLQAVKLPVFSQLFSHPDFLSSLTHDKKQRGQQIDLIGLAKVGEPVMLQKTMAKLPEFIEGM
ncbi:3-dehydroquinate synthase [Weissella ceti]|uniref:3-dehydroquinate synthase n=2 Tax=Weissella TaxID=46255 RepID=A0A075TW22_9LACO|nr:MULTISPECIES: 3-dehydroquinate synthase [Weissella]AIG65769.1 3-dehydroquinate synthase [Weissella tructae]AIM63148.1 3-dehydroquinate synthase [Weissella ceti]AIM64484.1 3-dehydroquinate synthase [Weissella ceti]ELA06778.1 3-dehydroquinate synthase [Weissella ceti NC36]QVV90931.1 3-dehydroquinate synthase [Weissella tructae]